MKLRLLILFVFVLTTARVQAQDPNLSLPFANPQIINPAFAGLVEGDFRMNAAHRWRRATLDVDMQTSFFSGDLAIRNRFMDGGAGLFFNTDKTPGLRRTNAHLSFAYEVPFGVKVRYHHLRAGFQAGIIHQNVTPGELVFEDQFNGTGFSGNTSENFNRMSMISPDISVGLLYYRTQKIRGNPEFNYFLGAAGQHVNRPRMSFIEVPGEQSNMRISGLAGGKIRTRTPIDLNISSMWWMQNNSQQLLLNFFFFFFFFENGIPFGRHNASVMLGASWRSDDALSGYLGFEWKKSLSVGVAADLYTPPVAYANAYGGLQVMVSYLFGHQQYRDPALPFPFF